MTESRAGEWEYPGLTRYITTLEAWFYAELHKAYGAAVPPDGRWRLCLGVLVYGDYLERFLTMCVPSLQTPGNLAALQDPLILIHTDAASVGKLEIGLGRLKRLARVEINVVPAEILDRVSENDANKYWLLGALGNLHMWMSKYKAHGYHMLMPDHVYAVGYFQGLRRLHERGEKAIVQGALSCVLEDVQPIIYERRLGFFADELNALALDHIHRQIRPFVMNGRADLPSNVFMLWVGETEARITSPHMSIVYLAHEVLMRIPLRLFNTIDAQLPFFIPADVDFHIPLPQDGMAYIEVSDRAKPFRETRGYTIEELAAHFWTMVNTNREFMRFFRRPTVLALPKGYKSPFPPMSDDEIAERTGAIMSRLDEWRDVVHALLPEALRTDPIERARLAEAALSQGA